MPNSRVENKFPAPPSRGVARKQAMYNLFDSSGSMRGATLHALRVFKDQVLDDPFTAEQIIRLDKRRHAIKPTK